MPRCFKPPIFYIYFPSRGNKFCISGKNIHINIGLRQTFAQSLALFASYLSQTCPNVTTRLELLQSRYAAPNDDGVAYSVANSSANVEPAAVKMTVVDLPLVNTRGGLYIFLNSLVR